ncbi:MAG: ATP-dependent RNA helicase RhlB, partial [Gammaproteobacteria bacterium]|nr:ATP-dependent RNA helicase RhlB [Gammaproteobacteria bacterium]
MSINRNDDVQSTSSEKLQEVTQNTQKEEHNKTQAKPRRNTSRRKRPGTKKPDWDISQFMVPEAENKTRFHDLGLSDALMHAIHDLGFEYCSPIQAKILPQTLKGLDAIGKAQTGTGKTAAFLITLINDILNHPITQKRYLAEPRALIVAPTRELVMQIATDARNLCKHTPLHVVTLVGGMDYGKQRKSMLSKLTDIVVATPGRLIDCMTRNDIHLDMVESLVLDEADRMLDMGFIPQVRRIVRTTPNYETRQTQLFSATFDSSILNLASQWTYEAIHVEIEPENIAADTVEQKVYLVSNEEKFTVFKNILKDPEAKKVIVFTNRRDQTQTLYEKLRKAGFNVSNLSGEIAQNKRSRTLAEFKNGKIKILVATDVMGRGIHIDAITHVINYNLPDNPEDYVHRIGRTGRAGVLGTAISLACEHEAFQLPAIEELLGQKLKCELPPE